MKNGWGKARFFPWFVGVETKLITLRLVFLVLFLNENPKIPIRMNLRRRQTDDLVFLKPVIFHEARIQVKKGNQPKVYIWDIKGVYVG